MSTFLETPDAVEPLETFRFPLSEPVPVQKLSVAIADPDRDRRKAIASGLVSPFIGSMREVSDYLPAVEEARWLSEQGIDAVLIAMDSDPEAALRMVESLGFLGRITVIVYSGQDDHGTLMRAMRAGAREFLAYPFERGAVEEALERVSVRVRMAPSTSKKTAGQSYVFIGAKGGAGVTTVACNFAVALAQESKQSVLLIDLNLPMGDAALELGIRSDHSTLDALDHAERLDSTFLLSHLVEHSSGLRVLASPGEFRRVRIVDSAVDRLLTVARNEFDHVVVDAGSRHNWTGTQLFDEASCIYLVTQVGIPELRNAHRLVTESIPQYAAKMEPVLNRYAPNFFSMSDELISKSLTMAPKWRIPSDFFSVRDLQNQASSLIQDDSPIARIIRKMARAASGLSAEPQKKKLFGLFG